MILLSLGLIMSLILIILILKGPSLKNKDKSNDNNKEKFQPKMPEGAYQSASELDQAEMEFVEASKGLIKQKQDDPEANMVSKKEMNDFVGLPQKTGYEFKDVNSIKVPGEPGQTAKDMKAVPNPAANTGKVSGKITNCKAITDCNQLTGKDCGYCGSSGQYSYGDDSGPKVDTCGKGQWSMTSASCSQTRDRNMCSSVDSCAELTGKSAEKCGFCPTTGGIMAMKKLGNKMVPKYASDTCNYEGGLLSREKCAAFAKDHPCITPYRNTGPHTEPCLRKLWKNSGCKGKKPYGKSFADLRTSIGSKSVSALAGAFKQLNKDTNAQGDMAKVVNAYKHCYNTKPNINPCDRKYFGTSLNDKTRMAREECSKKTWKQRGGSMNGTKYFDRLKKREGFSSQKAVLSMDKGDYSQKVAQMKSEADKKITDMSDYNKKNENSLAIYGVPADKPGALREGDYVKMHWTGKATNCFLYGYVIDKDSATNRWRVLWVIRDDGGSKEERTQKMKSSYQKEKFGWNGYKAIGSDMVKVGDQMGGVIGSQLRVLKRCKPGNSMCGNSCGELIMRLMDMYPRPQDCVVSKWTPYAECSMPCGGGKKTKKRSIVYPPMRGGIPCPKLTHTIGCNFTPCVNKNFKKASAVDVKGTKDKVNYVQITLPGGYLHVQEVEVYDEFGVNVAAKKNGGTATASSTGWSGHAHKPIDGQKDTRAWWSGPGGAANSVHTKGGTGQWWRVALKDAKKGKTHTISKIIIYNRPDGGDWRLNGAELVLYQGPPARSDWKKITRYTLTPDRRQVINLGNRTTVSCLIPNAVKKFKKYEDKGFGYCYGSYYNAISRQPNSNKADRAKKCKDTCMKNPGVKGFFIDEKRSYWLGRCFCAYDNSRTCAASGKKRSSASSSVWKMYDLTPYRGNKEVCNAKEFSFKDTKGIKAFKEQCKKDGGKEGADRCVDSFFEPSCHYTQAKTGKSSSGGGGGGDLDYAQQWHGWNSRNWKGGVERCAKECLKNPKCNRFTYGKTNSYGGWGLGCRTSTGEYNNGFSPVTTDRYKANGWKWWGQSNFWGGQVYDRKSANESFVGGRKEGFREGNTQKCKKGGKPFERIGDFRDTGDRDLPVYKGRVAGYGVYGDSFKCSYACKDYKYFGLQWWGQCFCGNSYGKHYEHTDAGKKQNYKHRHRWAWTYYGGWRNKVFRNNAYSKEKEGEWKDCAKYGEQCNVPDTNKYIMRFGKGKKWTEFRPKKKNEKCTFEGRWGVENPLGDKGSVFTGGNTTRPTKGKIKNATECAQHLQRRGAKRGWYGNWSRIPSGCFTYNHWWHKSRWGGWNTNTGSQKCGQNKGWGNRWICVNDKNTGDQAYKSGKCQIKKIA